MARLHRRKLCCLFSLVSVTCLVLPLFQPSPAPESRPRTRAAPRDDSPDTNFITTQIGSPPSRKSFAWNSGERYLAYLPHSGFHNQRIALENALTLARILNRTLLVPPVRLGNDLISYHKFDDLRRFLIHSGKRGLHHCSNVAPHFAPPSECWGYFDYTYVSWDWLVDLSSIAAEEPLLHHESLTYPWLESPPLDTHALTLKDQTAYDFRFVDYTPALDMSAHPRYQIAYPISTLATSSLPLIQLGSLFGSARLHLTERENVATRTGIRERMKFSNSHLRTASTAAVDALGGQDAFLAAHVRLSNGPFRTLRERTVRSIWYRLVACALRSINASAGITEIYELEGLLVPANAVLPPPHEPLVDLVPPRVAPLEGVMPGTLRFKCTGNPHEAPKLVPLNVPLFVATDVEDALALAPLRAAFPCTILLRDLAEVPEVRMLDRLVSADDGVRLGPFLAPLLDAAIVARAWAVVGTEGSTFSRYVEDLLWRREHEHQIVERG
ncbi:hypothetical protein DFH94DRAFT_676235 [Russula ochroleuca]|jgi:hypothetical protein|uniref:O-fucosyltransferase family protein n=1 Tax=Russula ochroleuca TaxID=152965 RepID=A0A9P5MQI2_9AGAM|nr:hypothetical protein DFH94DRAFT_676235 [Russula ochroleuca]